MRHSWWVMRVVDTDNGAAGATLVNQLRFARVQGTYGTATSSSTGGQYLVVITP